MLIERRGFIGAAVAAVVSLFSPPAPASIMIEDWLMTRLKRLIRFNKSAVIVSDDLAGGFWLYVYTPQHKYSIRVKQNYMGATVSQRVPRSGENWVRGNDLADGKCTEETWNRIVDDILAYELSWKKS